MENEEKEDLLIDVTEESDSDVSDFYIQEKIVKILEKEQSNSSKSFSGCLILIITCLILFISATVLLIVFPIYLHHTNRSGISTYSKLFTLTAGNAVVFATLSIFTRRLFQYVSPDSSPSMHLSMCLPSHLKASFLLSSGSLLMFGLVDGNVISCHLQDPLKGCVIVFSLMFYFIFSRRRTSVERVFCSITVIVGTFVAVDFGLCNRYRCRGADVTDPLPVSPSRHVIYVVGYILALAAYSLHWTCLENVCRSSKYSSSLDMSIVSNGSDQPCVPLPNTRSLSIISGVPSVMGRGPREPISLPLPLKFRPLTSTPNESDERWHWGVFDWLAAHYLGSWLVLFLCCWVPTLWIYNEKPILLVDVLTNIANSFTCHFSWSGSCQNVVTSSSVLLVSHTAFAISGMVLLLRTRSALSVACVIMNALPMVALFWSVYEFNVSAPEPVSFKWSITGEAVSAMLGFPIIGVGTFLLIKSHIAQPPLDLRS